MTPTRRVPTHSHLTLGYRHCRHLTWKHGTTYYWGAALLPPQQRRHVHAIYALCRLADDIVDAPNATHDPTLIPTTRKALTTFANRFHNAIDNPANETPTLAAIATTIRHTRIPMECFDRFFNAMAMDLDTKKYETWNDLLHYMDGSAAVIGEMMLPILGATHPNAREPARALGIAFQLTNFLRDVKEDLDRGRIYIPQEDLRHFGADPTRGHVDEPWRQLMTFQIARNRQLYQQADTGIPLLPNASARCVATARVLYSRILNLIENADYDIFSTRLRLPTWRKALTATHGLITPPHPQ
ncbi:Dehydrosqualene synthase [Dermatophilus congolensis]|uniref:Dehydrosqualene synthase n=1 Tax=Dermatophilus congolensis TaxID=1863 RepID=A0AA46BL51_9MICO|nr:phytoene/squalene synthase family protein [Dermatophilus congolensis]STD03243.1 Dehydrosqualene synthase [Dermatophilus congolensis]